MGTSTAPTRSRMLDAAIELFSTKGYEATSVADIQVACGLTAGSGALYKHFPSKRALLDEVIRVHVDEIAATRDAVVSTMLDGLDPGLDNLEQTVRLGARLIWESMDRNRAVIRLTLRDLEAYPELLHAVWDNVFDAVYRQAAQLMDVLLSSAGIEVDDPEATAAVLLGSLTFLPILQGLIGRTPGDVERERYLDAWVDHATRTITSASASRDDRRRS